MISNIEEFVQSSQEFLKKYETDIIIGVGVLLISLLSFAIGYLTAKEQLREPIRIEQIQE